MPASRYESGKLVNLTTSALQDYRVHLKHMDGSFEKIPYFSLPSNDLNDVIAPSCYSCFDYVNGLADLVRHLHLIDLVPVILLSQPCLATTCIVQMLQLDALNA